MLLDRSSSEVLGGTTEGKEECRKATRSFGEDFEVDMELKMDENANFWVELVEYRSCQGQTLSSASFTRRLRIINTLAGQGNEAKVDEE